MANGTDRRPRAFKELRAMTVHARCVIGVIDDVRIFCPLLARNNVARLALRLVLLRLVRKLGVVDNAD